MFQNIDDDPGIPIAIDPYNIFLASIVRIINTTFKYPICPKKIIIQNRFVVTSGQKGLLEKVRFKCFLYVFVPLFI